MTIKINTSLNRLWIFTQIFSEIAERKLITVFELAIVGVVLLNRVVSKVHVFVL